MDNGKKSCWDRIKMIKLSKCLNAQSKIYGLKSGGFMIAVTCGLIVSFFLSVLSGVIATAIGYYIGSIIADGWCHGAIQGWIYWNLPSIGSSTREPKSYFRNFI